MGTYKMNLPKKNPRKIAAMTTMREGKEAVGISFEMIWVFVPIAEELPVWLSLWGRTPSSSWEANTMYNERLRQPKSGAL